MTRLSRHGLGREAKNNGSALKTYTLKIIPNRPCEPNR